MGYTLTFMPSSHGGGESYATSLDTEEFNTKEKVEMVVCTLWDWLIELKKKTRKDRENMSGVMEVVWKRFYERRLLGGLGDLKSWE